MAQALCTSVLQAMDYGSANRPASATPEAQGRDRRAASNAQAAAYVSVSVASGLAQSLKWEINSPDLPLTPTCLLCLGRPLQTT